MPTQWFLIRPGTGPGTGHLASDPEPLFRDETDEIVGVLWTTWDGARWSNGPPHDFGSQARADTWAAMLPGVSLARSGDDVPPPPDLAVEAERERAAEARKKYGDAKRASALE